MLRFLTLSVLGFLLGDSTLAAKPAGAAAEGPSRPSARMMRRGDATAPEDEVVTIADSGHVELARKGSGEIEEGASLAEQDFEVLAPSEVLLHLLPLEELKPRERQLFEASLVQKPELAQKVLEAAKRVIAAAFEDEGLEVKQKTTSEADQAEASLEREYLEATGNVPGEDRSLAGLNEDEVQKVSMMRARLQAIDLLHQMKLMKMGTAANVDRLLDDFIEGRKGASILQTFIEETDKIPEPSDLEAKLGDILNTETFVWLERWLTGNMNIKDKMTAPGEEVQATAANRSARLPLWPRGSDGKVTVAFCRGEQLTEKAWTEFKKAYSSISDHCDRLNFVEVKVGDACQLTVKGNEEGCWAQAGYFPPVNQLNIQDSNTWMEQLFTGTCATKGIIEHELLHVLGFHHEQARADRNQYVVVFPDNVKAEETSSFDIQDSSISQPYSVGSIMHFGCKAHSKSELKDTIRAVALASPGAAARGAKLEGPGARKDCKVMGQRQGLNTADIGALQSLYQCRSRR